MRRREEKNFFGGSISLTPVAKGLNRICKEVEKEGLSQEATVAVIDDIRTVKEHFGISTNAAVLLAYIVENSMGNGADESDLAGYLGCSNIEFFGFADAISELEVAGIITRGGARGRRTTYGASREAVKSIGSGEPFKGKTWTGLTSDEFFTRLRMFFSDFQRDISETDKLLSDILQLIDKNPDLPFCKAYKASEIALGCPDTERRMFFYLCHRRVSYGNTFVPMEILLRMADMFEDVQLIRRTVSNGDTAMQKSGLVTFGGSDSFQDPETLALTDKAVERFLAGIKLFHNTDVPVKGLIPSSSITPKDLFYNAEEAAQMDRLSALLQPGNFRGVQERLSGMGMRKGFAVLFSGGAGCGKTAGAYELARRTGRDIFAVDMAELKSKWVGDSEKIVRGVFTTYAELCRSRENAPILLFNEADAIFAKRMENPRDSVDQMMNSIQNICLEAMENLDGILIATTNLAGNFCDEAFARRFIIKVEFTTPDSATRAKIWRSMIGGLSDGDAALLGERYTFSGGNIENIARKAAVGYVLSGREAGLNELMSYADEEKPAFGKRDRKIGFQ